MRSNEEYGLEDICTSLDAIETQLKRLVAVLKIEARGATSHLGNIAEIDLI